jgi:cbb3-type cytochrome oxidase subunit 3
MLHDFVARSGLSVFAEVALVIFLSVFVGFCLRVFSRRRGHYDAMARLPLNDDSER